MRILLIETDADISSFLKIGLEYYGYTVDALSEGIHEFSGNYDVIVLDTEIFGVLDLELCKEILNVGNTTPVVMLTSLDFVKSLVAVFDCKSDDYLIKPFAFIELLARLKAMEHRVDSRWNIAGNR